MARVTFSSTQPIFQSLNAKYICTKMLQTRQTQLFNESSVATVYASQLFYILYCEVPPYVHLHNNNMQTQEKHKH